MNLIRKTMIERDIRGGCCSKIQNRNHKKRFNKKKFNVILRWEGCICHIPCSSSWLSYFGTRSSDSGLIETSGRERIARAI